MNAGDTFIDGMYHHLWVVLSDPSVDADNVVIVNFTTHTVDEESSCIVQRGEHPFVKHKTAVRFSAARVSSVTDLERLRKANLLTPREACSASLLKKLRKGASADSHLLPEESRQVLDDQGFL
jgi:hypothetical protein